MDIGIAATCCEFEDINITAADLDDKIRRVAETSGKILQLRSSIPELSKWKGHISMLFREKAAKLQHPAKPTRV